MNLILGVIELGLFLGIGFYIGFNGTNALFKFLAKEVKPNLNKYKHNYKTEE